MTGWVAGMSHLNELAGRGGWIFDEAEFVWARVALDRGAVQARLPSGLSAARPGTGVVFLAHYPQTTFGSVYSEAGLLIDVRHCGRAAVHCPWMLVDDDVALIAGRELLGYPKKIGAFELNFGADHFRGVATRRGETLLRMTATLHDVDPAPPPILGQRVVNVRGPIGLVQRLVVFEPREEVLQARRASVAIEVHGNERDPLHTFGIGEVLSGHYSRIRIGRRRGPVALRPISPLFALRNLALRYT